MLKNLVYLEDGIKSYNKRLVEVIEEHKDYFKDDDMLKSFQSMFVTEERKPFVKLTDGFYECELNDNHILEELTGSKIINEYNWSRFGIYRNTYGVCDNYQQILGAYPELEKDENNYIVLMTPIHRDDQPQYGGWRWHKWGMYIGDYEPEFEYLYDENIDMVYVYRIYEID